MNTIEKSNKSKSSVIILIIVLCIYSTLIVTSHHYDRFSADSTLYLNIAEKYIRGDFSNAINGYWGPMLSWLLAPFLYAGASPVFAINAINLFTGLFTIAGVWILSFRFEITEKIRSAILISLLPIMMFVSIIEPFDFLLLCFIIFYLGIIFNNKYHTRFSYALLSGLLGACAYFTKSYGLPFFLVHFIFMNILHYIRTDLKEDKTKVVRNAIAGIVIFLIIISPWVYLISSKYGHFTVSNMGKGNFAAHAPGMPLTGYEVGGPMFHRGFFPPPNASAISAWEDPSFIWQDIQSWSPLESLSNFKYFVKLVGKNIFECLGIYQSFSRLAVTILIAYLLILSKRPFSRKLLRGDLLYSFFTLILYSGGYVPFHLELRYLLTINILLLLMGGYLLNMLFQNEFFSNVTRKNLLIGFFILSFMLTPLKSYMQSDNVNINKEMYMLGSILKNKFNVHGNIASNREWEHVAIHDSWHKTFRLSYWLNSKYYGQAKLDITDEDLEKELKKNNIEYYFIWGESPNIPKFLSRYREITNGEIPGLKIYFLIENKSALNQ